jgi:hypothetical protein
MQTKFNIFSLLIGCLSLFWLTSCKRGEAGGTDDSIKAGACTANDKKVAINPDNKAFKNIMDKCSTDAWGNAKDTAACLKKNYPTLSAGCADCYGKMADCGASNCKWKCFSNHFSAKCLSCVNSHCRDGKSFSLLKCTGLNAGELP